MLKSHTEETKRKIGEASHNRVHKRGRHWFNNGKVEIQSFDKLPINFFSKLTKSTELLAVANKLTLRFEVPYFLI